MPCRAFHHPIDLGRCWCSFEVRTRCVIQRHPWMLTPNPAPLASDPLRAAILLCFFRRQPTNPPRTSQAVLRCGSLSPNSYLLYSHSLSESRRCDLCSLGPLQADGAMVADTVFRLPRVPLEHTISGRASSKRTEVKSRAVTTSQWSSSLFIPSTLVDAGARSK